jgi:hypothetical protein
MRYQPPASPWVQALEIAAGVGFGVVVTLLIGWGLTEFFYWAEIW